MLPITTDVHRALLSARTRELLLRLYLLALPSSETALSAHQRAPGPLGSVKRLLSPLLRRSLPSAMDQSYLHKVVPATLAPPPVFPLVHLETYPTAHSWMRSSKGLPWHSTNLIPHAVKDITEQRLMCQCQLLYLPSLMPPFETTPPEGRCPELNLHVSSRLVGDQNPWTTSEEALPLPDPAHPWLVLSVRSPQDSDQLPCYLLSVDRKPPRPQLSLLAVPSS